ncbi:hypothetical protein Fmac_017837 [Flemingia macrophylla]|uniref:Uncharacterized protein n=1 Tax=Flemingia macrophylla TaxID=520843 RepID=A0ABD1M3G2_9FABA
MTSRTAEKKFWGCPNYKVIYVRPGYKVNLDSLVQDVTRLNSSVKGLSVSEIQQWKTRKQVSNIKNSHES